MYMTPSFYLNLQTLSGTQTTASPLDKLVIAGWTGRNQQAMEEHIVELEAMGIARPASTPIYYRVAASRLTKADRIEVSGDGSSGEVEFVLAQIDGRLWVGVGSDHTDRKLETLGVALSKQICEKPVGDTFWAFDEVAPHWDQLVLRSFITENGERKLYQEGPVTTMRDPLELVSGWTAGDARLPEGSMMFCGTLAAIGRIRAAGHFEMELHDPVLQRTLRHAYAICTLPIAG